MRFSARRLQRTLQGPNRAGGVGVGLPATAGCRRRAEIRRGCVLEVRHQRQFGAARRLPAHQHAPSRRALRNSPACASAGSSGTMCRRRTASSSPIPAQRGACPGSAAAPSRVCCRGRSARLRIGNRRAPLGSRNAAKRANSWRRPLRTASPSSPAEVAEEQKRCRLCHSSPMNSIGICGSSRYSAVTARTACPSASARQALAQRAIADLVVVLDEGDERRRRQMRARLAARAPR